LNSFLLISIVAAVTIASAVSHCVSVIRATNVSAIVNCSPYSKALLKPNKKIKKNAMLLNNSTESYLIHLKTFNFNLNLLLFFYINI
jgi:hypothetical protein